MAQGFPQRDAVVDYLRRILFGPAGGATEVVNGTPLLRYMTGILFPAGIFTADIEGDLTASAEEEGNDTEDDRESGPPERGIELASEALPSAVGVSFCVADDARVSCHPAAAVYEEDEGSGGQRSSRRWVRKELLTNGAATVAVIDRDSARKPIKLWGGLAQIVTQWRSRADGTAIVTVALVNSQLPSKRGPDPSNTLFQVGLRCSVEGRRIRRYPEIESPHDALSEESEVLFLYRSEAIFSRGHGAAGTWGDVERDFCGWVAVDFIPAVDVPRASFEIAGEGLDGRYCKLDFLINGKKAEVIHALTTLVDVYDRWVAGRVALAARSGEPAIHQQLADRAGYWVGRMRAGLSALSDRDTFRCFQLANEAMAIQMALSRARPKVPYEYKARRARPSLEVGSKSWRPFQIAFMLASLEPLANQESADRDIADVIWFPTGGGKTEAYLLVSAYELVRRRLAHGARDTATAVISRYTLRFLTAQQFQRTAALMAALEIMRNERHDDLGDRPFTLGLWVGGEATPNSFRAAHERLEEEVEAKDRRNPFLLQACPCCGTAIFPRRGPRRGIGVTATLAVFRFNCPNDACSFHAGLPLNVVDEALYQSPPSMLLGTVDKFAQLPWDDRARSFFGGPDNHSPPPSLILQDELHLISGPLGSLAAPYDAAIDAVIVARSGRSKRICSTATIRNAREQVQGLYGRQASVFPPPCSAWDDAFFFRTERSLPGRTYVGVMGQGYIKPVVAMAWTAAALLQSVKEVPLDPATLDAYWTLLAYHNSRRELGRTLSAARDEIQARVKAIATSPALVREIGEPLELSAQNTKNLGEAIESLEKPHDPKEPAVDLVPCTSIISVGVDLERLGLMLVNGQPKLTSEYIQATSRVGRGNVPGLVVSLFAATKPRDRSHYEDFRAFHESIYRHVEPTSVTPYALPARERTLHAAIVGAIRHGTRYGANSSAQSIDFKDPEVTAIVEEVTRIMRASDPSESTAITALVRDRMREWEDAASSGFGLLYERRHAGQAFRSLLSEYGGAPGTSLWPTMNSVRNVDSEARLKVS